LGVLLVILLTMFPVLAQEAPKPPEGATPAVTEPLPTVDEILNKYVEALGGKAAIEKITTRQAKGTFELPEMGASGTVSILSKAPDKTVVTIDIPGVGIIKQGFDGSVAWDDNPMSGKSVKSGSALAVAKRDALFHRELRLKELYKQIEVKGKQKVGEQDTYVLQATPDQGSVETWYFDVATGLLIRMDAERDSPQGQVAIQMAFKDFRDVEGVKNAFVIEQTLPNMTILLKIEEAKANVPIEDTVFAQQ